VPDNATLTADIKAFKIRWYDHPILRRFGINLENKAKTEA
jgi:hypothetical protein